jgi:hypothetical protein
MVAQRSRRRDLEVLHNCASTETPEADQTPLDAQAAAAAQANAAQANAAQANAAQADGTLHARRRRWRPLERFPSIAWCDIADCR